jgi:hypothetical protein
MAKIKKYQAGGRAKSDSVESEMFPGKKIPKSQSNYESGNIAKMLEAGKPKAKVAPKKSYEESPFVKMEKEKASKASKFSKVTSKLAPKKKMKNGGKEMMKRADGSYSQRGLWDNIRAAKGSGKKPTAAMLKQEKKIKAASKKK